MRPDALTRFKQKCSPHESGCVLWNGWKDKDGYGMFNLNRRDIRATHASLFLFRAEAVPNGMQVNHSCDNAECVNPDHLTVGTQKQNMIEMVSRGRVFHQGKHFNAKLSLEQAEEIRARRNRGERNIDIAKDFGIAQSTVSAIFKGRNWGRAQG